MVGVHRRNQLIHFVNVRRIFLDAVGGWLGEIPATITQILHKIIAHSILTKITIAHTAIPKTETSATGSMKAFIISGVMLTFSRFFNTFCGCVNWRCRAAVDVVRPFIAFGTDHLLHENSRIHHWHWQLKGKPFVAA
jgi:hypothetical protein